LEALDMSDPVTTRHEVWADQAEQVPALLASALQDALANPGTEITVQFAPGRYPGVPAAGAWLAVGEGGRHVMTLCADARGKLCIGHTGHHAEPHNHWQMRD
jgi:hypothetical protein